MAESVAINITQSKLLIKLHYRKGIIQMFFIVKYMLLKITCDEIVCGYLE